MTDFLLDENSRERLIEDYLFSGYKPASKSTFDLDQQFARPIEDEDIFGCNESQDNIREPYDEQINCIDRLDFDDKSFGGHDQIVDNNDSPSTHLFHESGIQFSSPNRGERDLETGEIDQIFQDDFSSSSFPRQPEQNDENARPTSKSYARSKPPPQPSPADIRKAKLKASILEQVKAKGLQPKTIGTGFSESGEVEIVLEQHKLVSDTNSKFIFNKLFNNSKKAHDITPERNKKSWESYSESLRKRMCTQKRKIWDTFQKPADEYDEEEELIELPGEEDGDVPMHGVEENLNDVEKDADIQSNASGDDPHELDREELQSEGAESVCDSDQQSIVDEEEPNNVSDEEVEDAEDLYNHEEALESDISTDSESESPNSKDSDEESSAAEPIRKNEQSAHPFDELLSEDSEDVVKKR